MVADLHHPQPLQAGLVLSDQAPALPCPGLPGLAASKIHHSFGERAQPLIARSRLCLTALSHCPPKV